MSVQPEPVEIRALDEADIEAVGALAREIWRAHYPSIISSAQIEYMLAERYSPALMRAELDKQGLWWDLLLRAGVPRAFSSYYRTARPDEMKLDKLYVHPDCQRRGYGALLIERALDRARSERCSRLVLAVNKGNANAIAAYRKHGFQIESAVVKEIGGGFVMDDYVMVRGV
jgi:ribosomal protein S18 acetylase RimI-like enzyme